MNNEEKKSIGKSWIETFLDYYGDENNEPKTVEAINQEWKECFMTDSNTKSQVIESWEGIFSQYYGNENSEAITVEEINQEWIEYFMVDYKTNWVLNIAA
ncbi:MAG: hypothetical protein PHF24_05795 [Syntrophomonas sp.]|nr:hypothetical protein [Syntrophomonas sp.]